MPHQRRIERLIAAMTLEEKIGQLGAFADALRPFAFEVNPETFARDAEQVREQIRSGRVGALFNGVGAAEGREAQRIAVEESRLGIPLLLGADVIHGMRTVFPIPLGEAASFEPDLAERTARATAKEATAAGIHWTFAPMVAVARDPRWGRVAETSGEDVYLSCEFAAARVRGFQGGDLTAPDSLLTTPKHFAAYGAISAGLDYNFVDMAPQTLRDVHLPPFKAALDAGALTLMSSFNDINGVPASANRELLTDILRGEWKFEGFVVSDYTSDLELVAHGYAADEADAAQKALSAGLDMSLQSGVYANHVAALVEQGRLSMAEVDEAVRRVLHVKAAAGLFDDPYRCLDAAREADQSHIPAHDALARDCAHRSIVLLKNEGEVLPLKKAGQRIALIGPFAQDTANLGGCWNIFGDASRMVDLETGLRAALDDPSALVDGPGTGIAAAVDGGIEATVEAARAGDVVMCMGAGSIGAVPGKVVEMLQISELAALAGTAQ